MAATRFHVVKLGTQVVNEVRRRAQQAIGADEAHDDAPRRCWPRSTRARSSKSLAADGPYDAGDPHSWPKVILSTSFLRGVMIRILDTLL